MQILSTTKTESQHDDDAAVARRIQTGDGAAFDELMARYKKPVLNFCHRILGNTEDAEDVAQDVFVRVHQHIRSFKPSGKFSTWLFALAHHACIDRLRWRQRHPAQSLDAMREEEGERKLPAPQRGVLEEVNALDIGKQIAVAVAELPEEQRTTVVLCEYHGMAYAEIARIMKCSEKSVEARLYRAKQALRGKLRHLLE